MEEAAEDTAALDTAGGEPSAELPDGASTRLGQRNHVGFELVCDDAATCCPPGLTAVVGTASADNLLSAVQGLCHVGLAGDDTLTNQSTAGFHAVLGGLGADLIQGGAGVGLLAGGAGDDIIRGSRSNDTLRGGLDHDGMWGGSGNDLMEGGPGNDRLLGESGHDILVPGSGDDAVDGGIGDDVVIIHNLCELNAADVFNGGLGSDTLVIPADLATVLALGVTTNSFEKVVVLTEAQTFDCGVTCDCPPLLSLVDAAACNFDEWSDPADILAAEAVCLAELGSIGPALFASLPTTPVAADLPAYFLAFFTAHPALADLGEDLGFLADAEPEAVGIGAMGGVPQPGVDNTLTPCDLGVLDGVPNPPLDVGIGEGGFADNCSPAEAAMIAGDVDRAKFYVWRALQAINAVVAAEGNVNAATLLWNQGTGQFSLAHWFGAYDADNARIVQDTLLDVWSTFAGNWAGGSPMHLQCWKHMRWWEWIIYFGTDKFWHKMILNPCSWMWANTNPNNYIAHTWYTALPHVTTFGLFYPVWSLELCEGYFVEDADERAATVVHEVLHHTFNDVGLIKDQHGSYCGGKACYTAAQAASLAVDPPEALTNNSSYHHYVRAIGEAYIDADPACDDINNALCFPSTCCNNGILEPGEGEACDQTDFGTASCADIGWSEGDLVCTATCQIDNSMCTGSCGNGTLDTANQLVEQCDGTDFGDQSCADFGFEMGDLICTPACSISTAGCSGGQSNAPPGSYTNCGVLPVDCSAPEDCFTAPDAGHCIGGPCLRSDPSRRALGQLDPLDSFHPKGDFKDALGNLHRCEDINGQETTCVDQDGWGVCKECGLGLGQTMLGCSCDSNDDCGNDLCWGMDFPNGGFCWPASGPPNWQCEQGACGQSIRDENDPDMSPAEDGGGYCEHYSGAAEAHCQPQRCGDIQMLNCSAQNLVCALTLGDNDCTPECFGPADCQLPGWPVGMGCGNDQKCTF